MRAQLLDLLDYLIVKLIKYCCSDFIFLFTELVQVQMTLSNPLNISLCLENLLLTYSFDKELSLIEPQVLDELLLAPSSTTQVIYYLLLYITYKVF